MARLGLQQWHRRVWECVWDCLGGRGEDYEEGTREVGKAPLLRCSVRGIICVDNLLVPTPYLHTPHRLLLRPLLSCSAGSIVCVDNLLVEMDLNEAALPNLPAEL